MRKYLFISTALLLIILTACTASQPSVEPTPEPAPMPAAQTEPEPAPQFKVPTFQLSSLPRLEPYNPPREIINRYYDESFVDILRPADDYGCLYPYVGKLINDNEPWATDIRYGLADAQGRIVVDSVYQNAQYSGDFLHLTYPMDRNDEELMGIAQASGWTRQPLIFMFAKADGTWVSGEFLGDSAMIYEDRIIITDFSNVADDYWYGRNMRYRLYDLQGNLLAENPGYLVYFYEGLGLVHMVNDKVDYWHYVDKQGEFFGEPMEQMPPHNFDEYAEYGGWQVEQYYDGERKLVFTQGDITRYVGYEDFVTLDYSHIKGDIFALSYARPKPNYRQQLRLDFYDAATGEILHSREGVSFSHMLNDSLLVLRKSSHDDYENNRFVALNMDFTPALEGDVFSGIEHIRDDVFAVHTPLYSGLIRQKGGWLLRVNINTVD